MLKHREQATLFDARLEESTTQINFLDKELVDSRTSLLVQSRLCTDLQTNLASVADDNNALRQAARSLPAETQLMTPEQFQAGGSSPSGTRKRPLDVSREEMEALKSKFRKKEKGFKVTISALNQALAKQEGSADEPMDDDSDEEEKTTSGRRPTGSAGPPPPPTGGSAASGHRGSGPPETCLEVKARLHFISKRSTGFTVSPQ